MASPNKKRRFAVVGGIIVIVIILAAAFATAGSAPKTMDVAQAAQPDSRGQKVEVSGNVVDNSFTLSGDVLDFQIYDPESPQATLPVRYDKGVASTFGNGVTAICTGTIDESGVLVCSELVTKCPSKYETATDALSVSRMLDYGAQIHDKPVKVQGALEAGSLKGVDAPVRMVLVDPETDQRVNVIYTGALSEDIEQAPVLVLTGSLNADGAFHATEVAQKED